MREIRTSGSEGGGAGNSTGSPYPYREGGPLGLKQAARLRRGLAMQQQPLSAAGRIASADERRPCRPLDRPC